VKVYNLFLFFQAQVSLDHDYCSSGNKANKRHRWTNPTPPVKEVQPQKPRWTTVPNPDQSKHASSSLLSVNKVSPSPIVIATSASSSPRPVVRVVTGGGAAVNRYHSGVSPSPIRIAGPTPTPLTLQNSSNSVSILSTVGRATTASQPQIQLRGENDPKKDSGLESGEVSDASEGAQPGAEDEGLFSKVPAYLTSVNVENSDSRTIAEADDGGAYDRLPAYVKGVASIGVAANAVASRMPSSVVTLGDDDVKSPSSSFSRSRSPSLRRDTSSPVRHSSRLRHRRSSSSSSKSSEPRKSSSSSRRRSLKKRSSRRRSRSRSPSFSPSPPRRSHFRSRSPLRVGFSVEKQKLEQQQRQRREEKNRQVSRNKIVYFYFSVNYLLL